MPDRSPYTAVIGVDPGASGAAVRVTRSGIHTVLRFRGQDEKNIADTLTDWMLHDPCIAILERVHSMPRDSKHNAFAFGSNYGFVRGSLIALNIDLTYVEPKAWQFEFNLGGVDPAKRKNAHKVKAKELYPDLDITLDTCDAILIATYGHRKYFGDLTNGKRNNEAKREGRGILWTQNKDMP